MPIAEYPLKNQVRTGISYSMGFAEMEACVTAHLDLWRWVSGGYPQRFMARVVAWYEQRGLIASHVEDAKERAREKRERRMGRRGSSGKR